MKNINLIAGRPGAGKTIAMHKIITSKPARYIYAAPRTDLLDDAKAALIKRGFRGHCEVIYSDTSSSASVARRITDALERNASSRHLVLMITHAALIASDMEQYAGWHLLMDEAPANAVMTGTLHTRSSLASVKEYFSLEADPNGREGVMLLTARPGNVHDLLEDPQMRGLANLWVRARSCAVYINCTPRRRPGARVDIKQDETSKIEPKEEADAKSKAKPDDGMDDWADIAKGHCAYASIWTLSALKPFESVTIAAAGLEHSLVHICDPQSYDRTIIPPSASATGSIRIHYYDDQTEAGSGFFATDTGRQNLTVIALHLLSKADYWTCNEATKNHLSPLIGANYVPPMQEGSNRLRDARSCAAIYSAKITPGDRLLTKLYAIEPEQILRAREHEHLAQFVMRGAARCPDFSGSYDIYLYDLWQAERLQTYLADVGFPVSIAQVILKPPLERRVTRISGSRVLTVASGGS